MYILQFNSLYITNLIANLLAWQSSKLFCRRFANEVFQICKAINENSNQIRNRIK